MDVLAWLMEGDPAIRWQVMADLTDETEQAVGDERSRVAKEGWGRRLLDLRDEATGQWGGGTYVPKWTSTTYTLLLLIHMGLPPRVAESQRVVRDVRDKVRWRRPWAGPYFSVIGEPCVTAMTVAIASYFGHPDWSTDSLDWLLEQQRPDGGWNCDERSSRGSFHTTISVLEALHAYQASDGPDAGAASTPRRSGHEYLLERRMFRTKSTGEPAHRSFPMFSFPPRWHYDLLRGMDYMRLALPRPDSRCEEALEVIQAKRRRDGRWNLQNTHRGLVHFEMEDGAGKPSRWNTLRAARVLKWAGVGG
ncbi:MAG TPA: hypothetical protein VF246_03945 [Acidimicrobiia bacterium]